MNIIVSVIVPLLNEEKYIERFLKSLVYQTYEKDKMEIFLVDGKSKDKTIEIVESYRVKYKLPIKVLINEKIKTPYALNLAIDVSKGKYIIRLDAHAEYDREYIENCVYCLENIEADNVGGVAETVSDTFVGKAIAHMLTNKFGVGGSNFRVGECNKYVDTVPFGAYKKEVFEKVGLFNTNLTRSEDNDMNSRIRENGGKIWLSDKIKFKYYCRDTIGGIMKMALQNGNALFFTIKENKKAMSLRHFIPFVFLMSMVFLPLLSKFSILIKYLYFFEIFVYLCLDFYFSFKSNNLLEGLLDVIIYPLFHLSYGFGSLCSLLNIKLY